MNERGFSFIEGLLSLSFLLIICVTLFPFIFSMINNLFVEKKEMIGYRLLYEYVQEYSLTQQPRKIKRLSQGIEYELYFEDVTGKRRACFRYEDNQRCVK